MAKSKNVTLYLMDGNAKGKIKAQISNWNGIAYKIPRELLLECKDLDAFSKSGVYFLFGNTNVYIGKAEVRKNGKAIHQRIVEHESDKLKDKWNEVVIFTTKDKSWGLTEISFLENKFYNKVSMAGRYSTLNDQEPSMSTVTEEKESELEEFMDQAELILSLLGHQVFEPIIDKEEPGHDGKPKPVNKILPPLPEGTTSPCVYARTGLRNLLANGYVFTDAQMKKYSSIEGSKEFTHRNNSMFLILKDGEKRADLDVTVRQRYWAEEFHSGQYRFLAFSQWYKDEVPGGAHQSDFDNWYSSLAKE